MKHTLVFDYDGTIHNTMVIYESAFRNAHQWLVEEGFARERQIPSSRIAGWLGMNSRDMWNSFMPELSQKIREEASRRVGESMVKQVEDHKAVWYPGAEEMLTALKEMGFRMVILSNCKIAYRRAHWREFSMERWFNAFYDCESYDFAPKTEIIRKIEKDIPGPYIVIGDRKSDMECAVSSGSIFVGCRYGFGEEGELDGADFLADSIEEIPNFVSFIADQTNS